MARPQKFRLSPDDVLDPQNARKLAGHVAEIEFFRGEVEKLQAQIAGIYDAADDEGFDKKFIRKVVAIRAKDDGVAQAEQAGIDAYTEALEIGFRSRARVENPLHDADGVIIEDDETSRHGASGAETEAQVATNGAPASAQPIPTEQAAILPPSTVAGLVAVESPAAVCVQDSGDDGEGQAGATREHGSGELSQPLLPNDRVENTPDGQAVIVAAPHSEPAEGTTPTSAGHGDRGAVVPSAAPVVEPFVAEYADPGIVVMEKCPPEGVLAHPFAACWPVNPIDVSKGIREPIVKIGKHILDGRGRYYAAREEGIEYPVVQYDGTDPLLDCIRWNLASRKPSEQQRRLIAAKLAKLEPARADDIMRAFDRHLEAAE